VSESPQLTLMDNRLSVTSDITPDNAVAIRGEGERLIAAKNQEVVVDLSGLGAAHSVVLSLLLCWMRLARSRGQRLSFEGVDAQLASLATLSGLGSGLGDLLPGLSRS
jgi:phospholipid transport system transporter-binding protein